jgi:hypothetical protein
MLAELELAVKAMLVAQVHRQINSPQAAAVGLPPWALPDWELLRAQAATASHQPLPEPL